MGNEQDLFEVFQLQAGLCKSLSDPKRLRIIHELRQGPKSVGQIAEILGLKQSNTSQHLAILRKASIVVTRRENSTVYYSLSSPKIGEACDLVREVLIDQIRKNQLLAAIK